MKSVLIAAGMVLLFYTSSAMDAQKAKKYFIGIEAKLLYASSSSSKLLLLDRLDGGHPFADRQMWTKGEKGLYKNVKFGDCLTGSKNGVVTHEACGTSPNKDYQYWEYSESPFMLKNKKSGLCLERNDVGVTTGTCSASDADQQFYVRSPQADKKDKTK